MRKLWKVIGVIILTVLILGLICIGVGVLTGAEYPRIFTVLNDRFQIESTLRLYRQYFDSFSQTISGIFG